MEGIRSACTACSSSHTWQRQKSVQGYSPCNAAWKKIWTAIPRGSCLGEEGMPWAVVCDGTDKLTLTLLSQLYLRSCSKKLWSCSRLCWTWVKMQHWALGLSGASWFVHWIQLVWLADVSLSISLRLTVKETQQGDLWESSIKNDTWKKDRNLLKRME